MALALVVIFFPSWSDAARVGSWGGWRALKRRRNESEKEMRVVVVAVEIRMWASDELWARGMMRDSMKGWQRTK
ncbi:hypothetical protein EDD21DRAFT_391207 [Dissophora ornata]|nr:hypothetical protein EDD21DRAFT_391207 [Dissophora ornata]